MPEYPSIIDWFPRTSPIPIKKETTLTVDILAVLVEALARFSQRLIEGGNDHQLLGHARPLGAHSRVDVVDGTRLRNGHLLDILEGGDALSTPVQKGPSSEGSVLRGQIRLIGKESEEVSVLLVLLHLVEDVLHRLLERSKIKNHVRDQRSKIKERT